MAPGFDEGRRMTRSARRAHPEPTPEPPEHQESRSESEEPLDIEQERNANIETRIQRLQTVIQSRKDHLRDIFVLYNHRANPATYCTPEDYMDTSPDRSTADPPHMSPLLASLGEWRVETPPETPPMVDELPASVLEEDKLDIERLQEVVPKPVHATPPPAVVLVPVVVDDVEVASSYSDAQDMDIDESSSPRPVPEPLPEPVAEPEALTPAVVQPDVLPTPVEEAEPVQADVQAEEQEEPPAEQPAAPSPAADSPMTEPPPSPPPAPAPPVIRATSVVSTHTPVPAAPELHDASPALVHSTPEPSPPAVKSPTPKEALPAPSMPSPTLEEETPKEATPVPVERASTPTPAPEVSAVANVTAAPPLEELTSAEASATPAAHEPTPAPQEPAREPTPALQAPSRAPAASTPRPKSPTPAPSEPTPAPREPTPSVRELTASVRELTASAPEHTPSARDPTPSVREATPVREPTPSEHAATPSPPAREPSPVAAAAPSPGPAAEAMDVDLDEASDAPGTPPPPAAVPASQAEVSAVTDEASDGMSTATVEAVLDNDGMQVDGEPEGAASTATTPRQSPTTVSPSALEPPPVARAPGVTFNSALFGRPSIPKAPEPHASNAFTSPQRRVTNPRPYIAQETPIDFDFTPIAKPSTPADTGLLLVPESDFTRALALPPLAALPPTFNHTVKPAKLQRKREKERKEGAPKKDGEKEFIPLGLNRWAALIRANPVHKHIKKAAKVLFTGDWRLALDELMFLRAMDRIDRLKQDQMWSFRQPKRAKQPVHIKVHWDYLLDEMKWMRTDYREERKWKARLASQLAHACMAWVHAQPEERPSLCAKYRLLRDEPGALDDEDVVMDEAEDAPPAVPPSTPPPELPVATGPMFVEGWQPPAYGTPDPLGPPSPERLPNYDADTGSVGPATYTHLEPAVDDAAPRPVSELIDEVAMKTEETEEALGLGTSAEIDALDSDEGGREATAAVVLDEGAALKDAGHNPTLATTSSLSKLGPYKALRDPILSLSEDELWIDFNDLRVDDAEKEKLPVDGVPLPEIFPELDVYEPLPPFDGEIAMSILDVKNHPSDKRVDETFAGKLASTSIFMDTKPTLVGALNPAQNWRNGKWINLDDTVIHPPTPPVENKDWDHHMSELFKMHGTPATPRNSSIPKMPQNAHLRASELPWTSAEDDLLKSIVDRFPNNWHLVAEWFNSSRVTIDMDRRSPWDCCERWHRKFGFATDAAVTEQARSPSPNLYESSNARTLKRLASNTGLGTNTEPRKRRRLLHLQDAVRKVSKKREQQQRAASQTKRTLNANVHETHTKIAKSSMSALELTRLKCERDSQERQRQQQANEAMRNVAAQHPAQRQMILQQLGLMQRAPGQIAQLPPGVPRIPGAPQVVGMPQGMVNFQNLPAAQRAQFMRAQQVIHQAQQAGVAAAAGTSNASPMLQSSSPQTSPPRPGASGQGTTRPGSTAPAVPLDPAAFQLAQQQALHAAMMQGYGSEEQMRQRIGIQNMLAGSSTAAPPPPPGGS